MEGLNFIHFNLISIYFFEKKKKKNENTLEKYVQKKNLFRA